MIGLYPCCFANSIALSMKASSAGLAFRCVIMPQAYRKCKKSSHPSEKGSNRPFLCFSAPMKMRKQNPRGRYVRGHLRPLPDNPHDFTSVKPYQEDHDRDSETKALAE